MDPATAAALIQGLAQLAKAGGDYLAASARAEAILLKAHREGGTVTAADFAELELGIDDALDRIAKA